MIAAFRRLLALAMLLVTAAVPVRASTILYRTDAELVALSERVVHARALSQRTERPVPDGPIFTVTTMAVLEDLTGMAGATVEVWELGGVYGNEGMFVGGAVEYTVGREVLVCLERGRFGLRSVAMGFSKFDVAPIAGNVADGLIVRNTQSLQVVGGAAPGPERSLAGFRALVAGVRGTQSIVNPAAALMVPDTRPRFTTLSSSNPRWFEADSNTPVVWYQNSNAPNPLTTGDAVAEIQSALAGWTNPSTASIILQYSGTTSQAAPTGPWAGIAGNSSVISWEDPQGNITSPTLAVGGGFFSFSGGVINGVTYARFTRAYVMFNNAVELSSSFRQTLNFTRVLEHEIGHTIGLGHTDTTTSPNPNIMFASCCSSATPTPPAIGPDDLAGLNTLYPVAGAPATCTFTISPATAAPTAAGGTATVTVTASASTCAWTATVNTATFATVTAGASGTGSGTVTYSVSVNATASQRAGTLSIAGQTLTITQAASPAGCTYAITPTNVSLTGLAGATAVTVTTAAGCAWAAAPASSFISVGSGSPATGSGTVSLSLARNTTAAARSGTATIAGQTFTVTQGVLPAMAINRAALNFGAVTTGTAFSAQTPAQIIRVTQTGTTGTVTWTAAANVPWLTVSPASGTGSAALNVAIQFSSTLPVPAATSSASANGAITITYAGAATTSSTVNAVLRLPGQSAAPTGFFDTPATGATGLQGSLAVSGWALDDVAVARVEIWRDLQPGETTPPFASTPSDPRTGKVFIGNATFVEGARPDVEAVMPTTPLNYRSGWGYLLLTWGLWAQGNGMYTLHAFAFDVDGGLTTLGQKTVGVDNNAANRPFGSIDTPATGGTASGAAVNFGWGLTPKVNGVATCTIPASGVRVSIDSGPLMPVNFGANRADIAGAFPGFSNTNGAGGSYVVDTTALANGVHTIGWLITDDCGRADGVGSRFFTVQNGSFTAAEAIRAEGKRQRAMSGEPILVARGFGELAEQVHPGGDGERTVAVAAGERIEITLPRGFDAAYQLASGERRPLPAGAGWDADAGVFSWQPGPGFLGSFQLVFGRGPEQLRVLVVVVAP